MKTGVKIYFAEAVSTKPHFRRISAKMYEKIGIIPDRHFTNNKFILKDERNRIIVCHSNFENAANYLIQEFVDILNKFQRNWPDIAESSLRDLFIDNLFGPAQLTLEEQTAVPNDELVHIVWRQDKLNDKQIVRVFKNEEDAIEAVSSFRKINDGYYHYSSETTR